MCFWEIYQHLGEYLSGHHDRPLSFTQGSFSLSVFYTPHLLCISPIRLFTESKSELHDFSISSEAVLLTVLIQVSLIYIALSVAHGHRAPLQKFRYRFKFVPSKQTRGIGHKAKKKNLERNQTQREPVLFRVTPDRGIMHLII